MRTNFNPLSIIYGSTYDAIYLSVNFESKADAAIPGVIRNLPSHS